MNNGTKQTGREYIQAIAVFVIVCGLSLLSQVAYPVFGVVTIIGVAFPLIWGKKTGKLAEIGFTKRNIKFAWFWGVIGGVLTSAIGIAVLPELSTPPQLGLQLAIGIPIWVLIASPFQEFFFRGWLQTRFENKIGNFWGLLLATACFTAWHYFAPFASQTTVPLMTVIGALSTFGAGLVYAYIFQRTRNIIAPWLAHTLTGVTFIIVGAMDFTQAPN
ncbi:MAG: CPBP family intramembrane glutamic endopeptidase [Chloroflexota bacterium]